MIAYLKVQSDSFCTHSFVFSCSSCLNRMASVKIVEASIVCVANMDVTVLCRRLQILTFFSWFFLHEIKSTWSNLFPVIVFSLHLVCLSRCRRIPAPQFDQFDTVFVLGVTYYVYLNCHVCVRIWIFYFFLKFFARPTISLLGRTLNNSFEIVFDVCDSMLV